MNSMYSFLENKLLLFDSINNSFNPVSFFHSESSLLTIALGEASQSKGKSFDIDSHFFLLSMLNNTSETIPSITF